MDHEVLADGSGSSGGGRAAAGGGGGRRSAVGVGLLVKGLVANARHKGQYLRVHNIL